MSACYVPRRPPPAATALHTRTSPPRAQVQVLTLNGEPRIILPIPSAGGLCGICTDGRRVFVSDIDKHKIHLLRLTSGRKTAATTARDADEAQQRQELRTRSRGGGGGGGISRAAGKNPSNSDLVGADDVGATDAGSADAAATLERRAKEEQRDLALRRVLGAPSSAKLARVLGLPSHASPSELMQGVRLALRLLHPGKRGTVPNLTNRFPRHLL